MAARLEAGHVSSSSPRFLHPRNGTGFLASGIGLGTRGICGVRHFRQARKPPLISGLEAEGPPEDLEKL